MKKSKFKWIILGFVFFVAFLIDLFIPDPLPFIEEIVLIMLAIISGYKVITK